MHFFINFFVSADGLGRFDIHSLTDECRMELMVEGLSDESKANFEYPDGSYKPVCDWPIVECDADERVVQIFTCIPHMRLYGKIFFAFVPPLVIRIKPASHRSVKNHFRGTINTADLPGGLEECDVERHGFYRTIDMTTLPKCLTNLNVSANYLWGTLCLSKLPPKSEIINLMLNRFCGEIRLVNIPETLKYVFLGGNFFKGSVVISVRTNLFVDIQRNGDKITSVADENGEAHPEKGKVKGFVVYIE